MAEPTKAHATINNTDSGNADAATVAAFGDEWTRFDQKELSTQERAEIFQAYFGIFPWAKIPAFAEGFDLGCGSGRWASLVAPQIGKLNCIDASSAALAVARRNLKHMSNVCFIEASVAQIPLKPGSQDFGYSLGVLHHVPDTQAALIDCVRLLKPGAPFLVYLYYRFDNRPAWFRAVWQVSDLVRRVIAYLPSKSKHLITDAIAAVVYLPVARLCYLFEMMHLNSQSLPLSFYKDKSFYTMRTDSRDRFGTPLEQRFTQDEIQRMMREAGLVRIRFSHGEPYWVACGEKS